MIYVQVAYSATWDQMVNNCCRYYTYDLKSIIGWSANLVMITEITTHIAYWEVMQRLNIDLVVTYTSHWVLVKIPRLNQTYGNLNFLRSRVLSIWYRSTSVMSVTDYIFTNLMRYNSIRHIHCFLHRRKYQCMTYNGPNSSDSRRWE